jgi:iron-sulfur cluster repair protein YtfE (RIC family)
MESQPQWLFPESSIETLTAIRPLSLSILENIGVLPFTTPAQRIGDICKAKGISWTGFLEKIRDLEVPRRDSDWSRLPLIHLLDFLTQEHRVFMLEFLPAIKSAIASGQGSPEFLARIHFLVQEWPAFAAALAEHIADEETFLFPKILRYDYCARNSRMDPDFSNGSVQVFAAMDLLRNEKRQMGAIRNFLDASAYSDIPFKEADAAGLSLFRMLESFQSRLLEHSYLERTVLFPLAIDLEKRLYDRFIAGGPGVNSAPAAICTV